MSDLETKTIFDYNVAKKLLRNILKDVDESHSINHANKVLLHVIEAIKENPNITEETNYILQLASFLHDADDHKYFPNNKNYENARKIISELAKEPGSNILERKEEIIRLISLVSCSENGNNTVKNDIDLYPRYADRLESIGKIGIYRCYLYGKKLNRPLFTDKTLRATTLEELAEIGPDRFINYVLNRGKVGGVY